MSKDRIKDSGLSPIGLIGIGLVGSVLAKRFLDSGLDVLGFDVDPERLETLRAMGGQCAADAGEVARRVDHLVLSLPDTQVVRGVAEGPNGVLRAGRKPRYVIDTTTGDPEDSLYLSDRFGQADVYYMDATICGASTQLENGQAVLMVGGDRDAFHACADLWHVLTQHTFYLGPAGSGSKAKLATNLVLGLNRLVLAEGMVFAEKLGLPLDTFLELLKAGPAYSAAVDVKGQKMLQGDFEPVSRIRQHHKDVLLMVKHARQKNQALPLTELHQVILEQAMAAGEGDLDTSAVIREIRRRPVRPTHTHD